MHWTPDEISGISDKSYEQWKDHVLAWLPKKIVDMHVHSPLALYKRPRRTFSEGLIEIYYNYRPSIFPKNIEQVLRGKDVETVRFPPPYEEANPARVNKILVEQRLPCMLLDDDIGSMEPLLADNVKGIKVHHKIMGNGRRFAELVTKEKMEWLERHGLCMLIETPNPIRDADDIVRTASDYNINIILPHLAFNHTGFYMTTKSFVSSFKSHKKQYDALKAFSSQENIYLDIAMKVDFDLMKTAVEILGEDRIMYGSDYPFCFTPKIRDKPMDKASVFGNIIDIVVRGRDSLLYKNLYMLIWVLERVCEATGADKKKIMRTNAETAIMRR